MSCEIPFGQWPSSITIDDVLSASASMSQLQIDGDDLYWVESQPHKDGRQTLMRLRQGQITEVTAEPAALGTRVHEYGGTCYAVCGSRLVWSDDDGRVYLCENGQTSSLVDLDADVRFADFSIIDDLDVVVAVREDHRQPGEAITTVVALPLHGCKVVAPGDGAGIVLVAGADFYANPTFASGKLAWVEWNHPNMPWDTTRLCCAEVAVVDGRLTLSPADIYALDETSVFHPRFSPDGTLIAMSDETGFWLPTRFTPSGTGVLAAQPVVDDNHDYDWPAWVLTNSSWGFLDDKHLLCLRIVDGMANCVIVTVSDATVQSIDLGSSDIRSIASGGGEGYLIAEFPDRPAALVKVTASGQVEVIHQPSSTIPDPALTSIPQHIVIDTPDGPGYAWYYSPVNSGMSAPDGDLPPMIVAVHGGPTGMATASYDAAVQFWTSRGWAYLSVNYSGSSGYGRQYRNRLRLNWCIKDVRDTCLAVEHAIDQGLCDPDRVVIQGGSAGGATVLLSLATSSLFAAGISKYGVADLESLASDTHKFESRYLDQLIATYPDDAAEYRRRSPISKLDEFSSPMLIMQGTEDKVVPPNQSAAIAKALRAKGVPVALFYFEGEKHGWRKLESKVRELKLKLGFLAKIFGMETPEDAEEVELDQS